MGGLSNLVKSVVSIAKDVTETLQATVTYEKFIQDEKEYENIIGRRKYNDPVAYKVILEKKSKFVGIEDGIQGIQISAVQFVDPIAIGVRDRITLPDGSKPQIMAIEGVADPNGVYYAPRVVF